jgi:RHS repeat-associated protein
MRFTGHERDRHDGDGVGTGDDLDYMHSRYYSPIFGRFLSVDPKARRSSLGSAQRWNRYAYAVGSPLAFVDLDGRDISYANDKDRRFYERAARRNWRARRVLEAFAPGTGNMLKVERGDPGKHGNGTPRAAATKVTTGQPPTQQEMIQAYDEAGGGAAGDAAANELYEYNVGRVEATIVLGPEASDHQKLHELGHVNHALENPEEFHRQAEEANSAATDKEYRETPSEQYAEDFALSAKKKDPEPPER